MPDYAIYDPDSFPVANKIIKCYKSVDPSKVEGENAILISRETYTLIKNSNYHKKNNGGVSEFIQDEKDAQDAAEQAAYVEAHNARINAGNITHEELLTVMFDKNIIKQSDCKILLL